MATHGRLRRPNLEGRQAGGTPDRTAHEVRARDQPQDGQGAGPDDPANATAAGGPRDPVMDRRAFITMVAFGLVAAPVVGEAQQADKARRIGWLSMRAQTSTAFLAGCAATSLDAAKSRGD